MGTVVDMTRALLVLAAFVVATTAVSDRHRLLMAGGPHSAGENGVIDNKAPAPPKKDEAESDGKTAAEEDVVPGAAAKAEKEDSEQPSAPEDATTSADGKSAKPAEDKAPQAFVYEFRPGKTGTLQYVMEKPGHDRSVFPYKPAGYHPLGSAPPEGTATKDSPAVALRRDHAYHVDTTFGHTLNDVFNQGDNGMDFEMDNDGNTPSTFTMDKASIKQLSGYAPLIQQTQAQKAEDGTLRVSPYGAFTPGGQVMAMGPNGASLVPASNPFGAAGKGNIHNTVTSYMGSQVVNNDRELLTPEGRMVGGVPDDMLNLTDPQTGSEPKLTAVPDPDKFTCVKINNGTFMCHRKTHGNVAIQSGKVASVSSPSPEPGKPQQVIVENSDGRTMTHQVFNPEVQKHVIEETYTNHVWKPHSVEVKVPVAEPHRVDVPVEVPVAKPVPTPVPYGVPTAVPTPVPYGVPTPVPTNPFLSPTAYGPIPLFLEESAADDSTNKKNDAAASPPSDAKQVNMGMYGFGQPSWFGAPMYQPGYVAASAPYGMPSVKDMQKAMDAQSEAAKKAMAAQMQFAHPFNGFAAASFSPYPSNFNTYSPFGPAMAHGLRRHRLTPPAGFDASMVGTPMPTFMGNGPSPSMYRGMYQAVSPNSPMPTGYGYNALAAAQYDPLNALSNMKNVFGPLSWETEAKKADAPAEAKKADAPAEAKKAEAKKADAPADKK